VESLDDEEEEESPTEPRRSPEELTSATDTSPSTIPAANPEPMQHGSSIHPPGFQTLPTSRPPIFRPLAAPSSTSDVVPPDRSRPLPALHSSWMGGRPSPECSVRRRKEQLLDALKYYCS